MSTESKPTEVSTFYPCLSANGILPHLRQWEPRHPLAARSHIIIILQYLTLDVSFEWSKQTPAAEAPAVEKKEESTPTEETTSKEEKKPSESESAEKK